MCSPWYAARLLQRLCSSQCAHVQIRTHGSAAIPSLQVYVGYRDCERHARIEPTAKELEVVLTITEHSRILVVPETLLNATHYLGLFDVFVERQKRARAGPATPLPQQHSKHWRRLMARLNDTLGVTSARINLHLFQPLFLLPDTPGAGPLLAADLGSLWVVGKVDIFGYANVRVDCRGAQVGRPVFTLCACDVFVDGTQLFFVPGHGLAMQNWETFTDLPTDILSCCHVLAKTDLELSVAEEANGVAASSGVRKVTLIVREAPMVVTVSVPFLEMLVGCLTARRLLSLLRWLTGAVACSGAPPLADCTLTAASALHSLGTTRARNNNRRCAVLDTGGACRR